MQIKVSVHGRTISSIMVGLMALTGTLAAGEAIQFSSDKIKPAAAAQNPLTKDRLLPQGKFTGASPLDGASASVMRNDSRRRLDPKEEKRRENEKLEKENWMILDEGELQAQDEYDEVYGRNDFDSDKKRTSGDIWFAPKQSETARGGTQRARNGVSRAPAQNRPQDSGSLDDDKDTSFNFARRLGREADAKSDRGQATDSSAKGTLAPAATDSALKDLFNSGNNSTRGYDDRGRGRSELGLRAFDAPSSRASSFGSSFGLGGGSAASAPAMTESAFKPTASAPPSLGRSGGAGLSDSFPLRGNPGIGGVPPQQTQPQADSSPRSTRGSFDIPLRPGFGR
jgi:hypothetical protein